MANNNFKYIINTQLKLDGGSLSTLITDLKAQDEEIKRLVESISKAKITFDTTEASEKIADLSQHLENIKRNSSIEFRVSESGLTNLNSIKTTLTQINAQIAKLSEAHEINIKPSSVGDHIDNEISNYKGEVSISRVEFTSEALANLREQIEGQKYKITAEIIPSKKIKSADIVDWSDLNTARPNQQNRQTSVTVDGGSDGGQGRFRPNEIRNQNQGHNYSRPHLNFENRNRNNNINDRRPLSRNNNPTNNPAIMDGLPTSVIRRWYEDDTKYIEQNLGQQNNRQQQRTNFSGLNQGATGRRISSRRNTRYSSQPSYPTPSQVQTEANRQETLKRQSEVKRQQTEADLISKNQQTGYKLHLRDNVGNSYIQQETQRKGMISKLRGSSYTPQSSVDYSKLLSPELEQIVRDELKRANQSIASGKSKMVDKMSGSSSRTYVDPKEYFERLGSTLVDHSDTQKKIQESQHNAVRGYNSFVQSQQSNPRYDSWLQANASGGTSISSDRAMGIQIAQQAVDYQRQKSVIENQLRLATDQVKNGTATITPDIARQRGYKRVGQYGYFPSEDKILMNPNSSPMEQHQAIQKNLEAYKSYAKQQGQIDPTFKGFSKTFSLNFQGADGTLHQIQSLTYNIDQFGQASQRGAKGFRDMVGMMAEKTFIYGTLGTAFYQISQYIGEAVKNMSAFQQQMIRFQTFTQGNPVYSQFNQQQTTDDVFGMASQYGVSATNAVMPAYQDVIRRQDLIGVNATGNGNQVVNPNGKIKADRTIANNLTEKALQMGVVSYGPALNNEETQKVTEDLLSVYSNTFNGTNPSTGKNYTPNQKMGAFNQYMDTIASFEKYGGDASKTLDVVGELAPEASNMGINEKTLAGLASGYTLKNTDADPSTISTTLKTLFSALERPDNSNTLSALQAMGIDPFGGGKGGTPLDPQQIIDQMVKKYPNVSKSTRSMVAMNLSSLGGGRSSQRQAQMQQLLDSFDIKTVREQFLNPYSSSWNAQGTAKTMAQSRMDSLHGQWSQLDEKMDQFIVALGNGGVLGALTNLLKGLNGLLSVVNGIATAFGKFGTWVDQHTGGVINPSQTMGQVATGMAVFGAGKFAWNKLGTGRQQRIKGFVNNAMQSNPNTRLQNFNNSLLGAEELASSLQGGTSPRVLADSELNPEQLAQREALQTRANRYNALANRSSVRGVGGVATGISSRAGNAFGWVLGATGLRGRSMVDEEGNALSRGARARAVGSSMSDIASTGMKKFGTTIVEMGAELIPLIVTFGTLTLVIGGAIAAFKLIQWLFTRAQNQKNAQAQQQADYLYGKETSLAQSKNPDSALKAYNVTGVNDWIKLNDKSIKGQKLSASEQKRLNALNKQYSKVGMKADGPQTTSYFDGVESETIQTGPNQYEFIRNGKKVTGNATQLRKSMSFGAVNSAEQAIANSKFSDDFSKVGIFHGTGGGYLYQATVGESQQLLNQMQGYQNQYQVQMAQNQAKYVGSDTQAGAIQANINSTQQYLNNSHSDMAQLTSKGNSLDSSSSTITKDLKDSGQVLAKRIGKKGVSDLQKEFMIQVQSSGNAGDLMTQYESDPSKKQYVIQMQQQWDLQQAQLSNSQSVAQAKQEQEQLNAQMEQYNAQLALAKTGVQSYQQAIAQLNNTVAQGQALQSSATTYEGQVQGGSLTMSGYTQQLSQYQQMASSIQSAMSGISSANPNQDFSISTLYGSASNGLTQQQQNYKAMLDSLNQAQQGISTTTQAISQQRQQMISLIMNTDQYRAMWARVQQTIETVNSAQQEISNFKYANVAMNRTANLQSSIQGASFDKGSYLQSQYQQQYQSAMSQYSQLQQAIASYPDDAKKLQDAMNKVNGDTTQGIVNQVVNPLKDLVNNSFKNSTDSFNQSTKDIGSTVDDFSSAVKLFSDSSNNGSSSSSSSSSTSSSTSGQNVATMSNTQILDAYMKEAFGITPSSKTWGSTLHNVQTYYQGDTNKMYDYMRGVVQSQSSSSTSTSSAPTTGSDATVSSIGGGNLSMSQFVSKFTPYAEQVSKDTGAPVAGILTQWAEETGHGNSSVALKDNNLAGISKYAKYTNGSDGGYAKYNTMADWIKGYELTLKQSNFKSATNATSAYQFISDLKQGGWATDPNYVSTNMSVYKSLEPYLSSKDKGNPSSTNGTANSNDPIAQASQKYSQALIESIQMQTQAIQSNTDALQNNGIAYTLASGIRQSNAMSVYAKDPFQGITNKYNSYQQAGESVAEQQYQVTNSLSSYQAMAQVVANSMKSMTKGSDQWNASNDQLNTLNSGIEDLQSTLSDLNKTAKQYLDDVNQDPRLNSSTASQYIVGGNNMIKGDKTGSLDYYSEMNAVNQYYQNFMTTAKKNQVLSTYWDYTGQQTPQYDKIRSYNDQNNTNILFSKLNGLNDIFKNLADGTQHWYSTLSDLAKVEQQLHDLDQQKLQDDQTLYSLTGKGLSEYTNQLAYTQTKDYNQAKSNVASGIKQLSTGLPSEYSEKIGSQGYSSGNANSMKMALYEKYGIDATMTKGKNGLYTLSTGQMDSGTQGNVNRYLSSNYKEETIGKTGYSKSHAQSIQETLKAQGIDSSLTKLKSGQYTVHTSTATSQGALDKANAKVKSSLMTEQIGKEGYSKSHAETVLAQLKKQGINGKLVSAGKGMYTVQTTTAVSSGKLDSVNKSIEKADSYVHYTKKSSLVGSTKSSSIVGSKDSTKTSDGKMDFSQQLANYQIISENSQKMTDQMNTYRDAVTGAFQAGSMSVQDYIKKLNDLRDTQKEAKQNATAFATGMQGDFQNNLSGALQSGMNGGVNSPTQFIDSMKQSFSQEISQQMSSSLLNNSGLQNVMNGLIGQVGAVIASGNPTQIANMFSGNSLGDQFNSALQPFLPLINQIVESTKGILTTITDQNYNSPNGFKVDPYLYQSLTGNSTVTGKPTSTYTNGTGVNGVGSPSYSGGAGGGVNVPSGNTPPSGVPSGSSSGSSTGSTGGAAGTSGSGSKTTPTKPTSGSSGAKTTKAPSSGSKTTTSKPSSSSSSSSSSSYTVKSGDTLSGIGSKLGIDWHSIASLNGIKSPYKLSIGEHLKIPGKSGSSSSSSSSTHYYTVQKGDNPWDIENKLHISHGTLEKKNPSMNPNKLQIGQKLKYHTGGFVGIQNFSSASGLQPNEISAIFQKGETALQPKQLSDLIGTAFNGGVSSGQGNVQHNTTVHVNVPAGSGYDQKGIEGVVQTAVSEAMIQMQKSTRRSNLQWNGTPR